MPRKRTEFDRAEKVEQILDRAATLLREGGYDELSINRVACDIGVARAAVYWYFPSRDELFVAACARVFAAAFADPPAGADHRRRIEWGIARFADVYGIYAALLERAPVAPAAHDLLDTVQRDICARLEQILAPRIPQDRLHDTVETLVIFIEGLLGRRLPAAQRNRHLSFALDRLLDATP